MGDSRVELEITLEDGKVVKGFANIEKAAEKAGKAAGGAFDLGKAALSVTGVNQALELTKKIAAGLEVALSAAFDFAKEAEAVGAITRQFEVLTERAGASGDALKSALMGAADGLIDDSDIMQAANKALLELGDSAEKLPGIMSLARKATAVMGGDLKENFEQINQAISSGRTKSLQALGIFVDGEKAVKEYARSIGTTADALTQAGRQHAILNAILEKGQTAFNGIEPTQKVTDAFTRMKVAIGEAAEEMKKAFTQSFGPSLEAIANKATDTATKFSSSLKFMMAGEEERKKMAQEMIAQQQQSQVSAAFGGLDLSGVRGLQGIKSPVSVDALKAQASAQDSNVSAKALIDPDAVKRYRLAAESELVALHQSKVASDEALLNQQSDHDSRLQELEALNAEKLKVVDEQFRLKAEEVRNSDWAKQVSNTKLLHEALELLEKEHQNRKKEIVDSATEKQRKQLEDFQNSLKATFKSGFTNAIASMGAALAKGENIFSNFGKALLGMLGDIAIQIGSFMLFAGMGMSALGKFNPEGGIIAGMALIAIGGALKALSGGGDTSSGGGVASSAASGAQSDMTTMPSSDPAKPKTEVHINIQGNVLDRRESGMAIADILNEYFAANDGRIVAAT